MNKLILTYGIYVFALLGIFLPGCNNSLKITKDPLYPKWLMANGIKTDQTSGISFIKQENGTKHFILADDIGDLYRLAIKNDTDFTLNSISFSDEVKQKLDQFPKKDFEDIVYDHFTNKVYLSIEGNKSTFLEHVGIYEIEFYNNNIFSDSVISLTKLNIEPKEELYRYVKRNIGFEGIAVDENYLYLGLEGFSTKDVFADSTLLYIVDKKDLKIVKIINTFEFGIGTICGLYSNKNGTIWGIDRNRWTIFNFAFDSNLNIVSRKLFDFFPSIPGYNSLTYVAALESITIDNEGYLYLVDDPYRQVFIPPDAILNQLDEETKRNFKNYIPIIYRYKITY